MPCAWHFYQSLEDNMKKVMKWISLITATMIIIAVLLISSFFAVKQSMKVAAIEGACIAVDCINRHIAEPRKVNTWDCIMKNFAKQGWELVNAREVEKTK